MEQTFAKRIKPLLYLSPFLILVLFFRIIPLFQTLRYSFFSEVTKIGRIGSGFGFDAFVLVWQSSDFQSAIWNTILLIFIITPLVLMFGFIFAYLLNISSKVRNLYETLFFLPYIIPGVAMSIAMYSVLNFNSGLLNIIINALGQNKISWLADPSYKFLTLCIYLILTLTPFTTLMFLNSLQGVNRNHLYISKIEGDNFIKKLIKVVFPSIKYMLLFLFVSTIIAVMKVYTSIDVLFDGPGNNNELITIIYYIKLQLDNLRWNYAGAASIYLLLFALSLIMIRAVINKKIRRTSSKSYPRSKLFYTSKKKVKVCNSFMILGLVIFLTPLLMMLVTVFKTSGETINGSLFPSSLNWESFTYVFGNANIWRFFQNSLAVALIETTMVLITSILAAYALTHINFKYKKALILIILILMTVPSEVLIMNNYINLVDAGMYGTYIGLAAPSMISCYFTFLLIKKFETVSKQKQNVAKIEGSSEIGYITKILIPSAKHLIIMIAIIKIIGSWSQYLWPLMMSSGDLATFAIAIREFSRANSGSLNYQMAITIISIVPLITIYLIFKKYIINQKGI